MILFRKDYFEIFAPVSCQDETTFRIFLAHMVILNLYTGCKTAYLNALIDEEV